MKLQVQFDKFAGDCIIAYVACEIENEDDDEYDSDIRCLTSYSSGKPYYNES